MKIKINEALKGIDGVTPLPNPDGKGANLTLKDIIIASLLSPIQGESEKEKLERYDAFKKVRDSSVEVDLKAEEVVIIKKTVGKFQPPLVMGQAFEMIDK